MYCTKCKDDEGLPLRMKPKGYNGSRYSETRRQRYQCPACKSWRTEEGLPPGAVPLKGDRSLTPLERLYRNRMRTLAQECNGFGQLLLNKMLEKAIDRKDLYEHLNVKNRDGTSLFLGLISVSDEQLYLASDLLGLDFEVLKRAYESARVSRSRKLSALGGFERLVTVQLLEQGLSQQALARYMIEKTGNKQPWTKIASIVRVKTRVPITGEELDLIAQFLGVDSGKLVKLYEADRAKDRKLGDSLKQQRASRRKNASKQTPKKTKDP